MRVRARPFLFGSVALVGAACGAFSSPSNESPGSLDGGTITLPDGALVLPDGAMFVPDGAAPDAIELENVQIETFQLSSLTTAGGGSKPSPINYFDFASTTYDGNFVYTATRGATTGSGYLRYDSSKKFTDASSWELLDSSVLPEATRINGPEFMAYDGDVLFIRGQASGTSLSIGSFDVDDDDKRNAFNVVDAWDREVTIVPNDMPIGAFAAKKDVLVVFKWTASQMYSCDRDNCATTTVRDLGTTTATWKISGATIVGNRVFTSPSGFGSSDLPFLVVPLQAGGSVSHITYPGVEAQTTYEFRGVAELSNHVYYAPYRKTANGNSGQPLQQFARLPVDETKIEVTNATPSAAKGAGGFAAVVSDRAQYVYFIPAGSKDGEPTKSLLVRYDTRMDFNADGAWKSIDLELPTNEHIASASYDGRALYLFPADSMTARRIQVRNDRDPAFADGNYEP